MCSYENQEIDLSRFESIEKIELCASRGGLQWNPNAGEKKMTGGTGWAGPTTAAFTTASQVPMVGPLSALRSDHVGLLYRFTLITPLSVHQ